jgi:glycine/D-amino acid oxidase-like deaminating enzyme
LSRDLQQIHARSLWLHEALRGEEEARPLRGDVTADVCIVGGGYTGLWAALGAAAGGARVVLLEGDVCGGGASGRNGGFVLTWWSKFATLRKRYGNDEALRLAHASAESVGAIGAFCAEHGIDAGYQHEGWLWAATTPAQNGAWEPVLETLADAGEQPFVALPPEEVARRAGSDRHLAGVWEPVAATVQPALLARGLRRVAIEHGVEIHERSRAVALDRGRPPRVVTAGGSVTAGRVVVATGAWAISVRELRRALVVVSSDIVATEPAPELIAYQRPCVSDSRLLVHYHRPTRDGRLVLGKGGGTLAFGHDIGTRFDGPSPNAAAVEASVRRLFPQLADVPVSASWWGPVDRSLDGLPFITRLDGRDDLLACAGFSGNGVGPSHLLGRILAELVLGRDDGWGIVGDPPGRFPPEPIRYAGGRVVQAAVRAAERADDDGRRPSRVAVGVARLAPAGLVPLKSRG